MKTALLVVSVLLFSVSCKENLPLDKDLTKKSYSLINQDSVTVIFPEIIKGTITVAGFIYTHCPDICPMTTHNMYLTRQKLKEQGINDIKFVSISFDPERDSPTILKKYAEIRDLDLNDWTMFTGEKPIVYDLLRRFDVRAIATDTLRSDDGEVSYSMMHTDRISLIDEEGRLRKNYVGSKINIEELIKDIKNLGDY
jgi:protein SCO1/2